ncbi:MAG: aminotransferase class V-fold PLP-dependent enzyme [Saprospirales bacterium]|nr:aminotransferase class V-fold PLP-dependent enzyme [Saprospirales bacterium]
MLPTRRHFLQRISAWVGTAALVPYWNTAAGRSLQRALVDISDLTPGETATDETFWYQVKQAYTVSPQILNLNNGGVSPQPLVVQEAVERYNRLSNEAPSYYMWQILDQGREPLRAELADLAGCSPEEIAINRNSSEALETVIFGLRLQAGDEVVLTKQDYPNMINAWKQREKRDGIVLRWLNFEFPIEDKAAIVQEFVNAFTDKTKVVHITHLINWIGQLLPAREIALEAKKRGIEVLVDGAHSFAHFDFKIPDLECDYFGTSLHKWLCAPFGSGLLYVKKEKITGLYPLFGAPDPDSSDIRKFESLGTRSFAIEQAIGQAIQFHHMIGAERKFARLHYLKNYWAEKVVQFPGVRVHTSLNPEFAGAIALISVDGKTPEELASYLMSKHRIHTVAINWENIHGVRVTPNVYTVTRDLDRFVQAVKEFLSF